MATRRRSRKVVRYAVIGLGHIAQGAMLPAFRHARRNSELVALVSGDQTKLRSLGRRYGVKRLCDYEGFDELLTSGDIDALYIALPNDMHLEYAVRAAQAGVHVLCEKPMALTAADCEHMIRVAQRGRVKLMIAYRLHFERANLEAALHARGGKIGDLRYFSSDFSMQVEDDNIRLESERGGGPLYDIGIYCINAIRYCFGAEPTAVWATTTRSHDARFREVDETVVGVLRFDDDRVASFTCSFGAADRSTYTITGTRGSITVDPAYEYAEGLGYELRVGSKKKKKTLAKSDQFAPELLYFSDCILKDRVPEPTGEEGLADVRIIEAMQKSIRRGRWVPLSIPERKRRPTLRQELRRPAVPREPSMVNARSASQ